MKYHGHYLWNRRAILSYSIEGREVLELPGAERTNDSIVLLHTLTIGPGSKAMRLCVAQGVSSFQIRGLVTIGQTIPKVGSGPAAEYIIIAASGEAPGSGAASQTIGDFVASAILGESDGMTWETDDQQRLV